MGCIFALFAVFTPRLALVFLWIFTESVNRAFDTFIIPLLGFIFLPFTTIIYVLVYNPATGMTGWDWVWVILALLLDLGSYGGSAIANKNKMPGASSSTSTKETTTTKESEE